MSQDYSKVILDSGVSAEAFNHKLCDFFPGLIFTVRLRDYRIDYINKQITSLLGFSKTEILEVENIFPFVYKEDVNLINKKINEVSALKNNDGLVFICRLNKRSGECRYFNFLTKALGSDNEARSPVILFIGSDVTDKIKEEKESEEMAYLFRDTEDLLQFGSWSWDPKTDQLEWTKGMYDLLGYKRETISSLSGSFYFRQVLSFEEADKFREVLLTAIENKCDFEHEYIVKTASGIEKNVFTKGKVILDADGIPKKIVGVTRDITALKNLERERERTIKELNRSNKELEEFAYIASHDLQEPLRKISTFNERLKKKYGEILGTDGNVYLDRIISSTDNMRILIDNLLEFSRTTRSSRAFATCDLNITITEAISDQELKIEETGCVITISKLPVIEAVPVEMKQLFTNLISNAIKFRKKESPPAISIAAEKVLKSEKNKFHLPLERNYQRIEFKDNGIGFEEEYSERIFQIFQRLHGKSEYAGSGIGLAICKKIVENHDGVIFATGKPGEGATFTVILPEVQSI